LYNKYHYKLWKPEYTCDTILKDAYDDMKKYVTASQKDIPFIVQLIENPKYKFLRFGLLKGSTSLEVHDLLHIILKQTMHMSGEAYVIGFTMGSTKKTTKIDILIFSLFAKYLYPKVFRFNDDNLAIFNQGIMDGHKSTAVNLNEINTEMILQKSLSSIREMLKITNGV